MIMSYNGHGDIVLVKSVSGETLAEYAYDEFGNPLSDGISLQFTIEPVESAEEKTDYSQEIDNPYRYAGYEYLDSVDLYDLNARYYNPKTARFLSEDPYFNLGNRVIGLYEINVPSVLSIMQANALYAYALGSPIGFYDPKGKSIAAMFGLAVIILGTVTLSSCSNQSIPDSEYDPKSIDYIPGSKTELNKENLGTFYFKTEEDAAMAFGFVYGGSEQYEYGAAIDYDSDDNRYYIQYVYCNNTSSPGTSVMILANNNTTAKVHTHPWESSLHMSDNDLYDVVNAYVVMPSGKVYQAIYDKKSGQMVGPTGKSPNKSDPIGTTGDWFNGK